MLAIAYITNDLRGMNVGQIEIVVGWGVVEKLAWLRILASSSELCEMGVGRNCFRCRIPGFVKKSVVDGKYSIHVWKLLCNGKTSVSLNTGNVFKLALVLLRKRKYFIVLVVCYLLMEL